MLLVACAVFAALDVYGRPFPGVHNWVCLWFSGWITLLGIIGFGTTVQDSTGSCRVTAWQYLLDLIRHGFPSFPVFVSCIDRPATTRPDGPRPRTVLAHSLVLGHRANVRVRWVGGVPGMELPALNPDFTW